MARGDDRGKMQKYVTAWHNIRHSVAGHSVETLCGRGFQRIEKSTLLYTIRYNRIQCLFRFVSPAEEGKRKRQENRKTNKSGTLIKYAH